MKETLNYKLKKIELTDSPPDITIQSGNFDIIDEELKNVHDKANGVGTDLATLQKEVNEHKAEKATQDKLGHVKAGQNIRIDIDGTINAETVIYEEGEWEPTPQNSSSCILSKAYGRYVRINNMVTVWFHFDVVSGSCVYIHGLPFVNSLTESSAGVSFSRVGYVPFSEPENKFILGEITRGTNRLDLSMARDSQNVFALCIEEGFEIAGTATYIIEGV